MGYSTYAGDRLLTTEEFWRIVEAGFRMEFAAGRINSPSGPDYTPAEALTLLVLAELVLARRAAEKQSC